MSALYRTTSLNARQPLAPPRVSMLRRLGREAARAVFVAALLLAGLASWLVALAAPLLGGGERRRTVARAGTKLAWTPALHLLPWVTLAETPPAAAWDAFAQDAASGAVLLLNHASGMDPLVLVALCPWRVVTWLPLRVLVHAAHFRAPLFGRICRACGHFPVHLEPRTEAPGRHVNRTLQARAPACSHAMLIIVTLSAVTPLRAQAGVMDDVARHVAQGGVLVVFPGAHRAPLPRHQSVVQLCSS